MTRFIPALVVAVLCAVGARGLHAQPQAPSQETPRSGDPLMQAGVPLQVQVVLARFQGDTQVSRVPYLLSVNAVSPRLPPRPAQLRMGRELPGEPGRPPSSGAGVVQDAATSAAGNGQRHPSRPVGTNIDCRATVTDDGRYQVSVTIEDSWLSLDAQSLQRATTGGEPPIIRTFRFSNGLPLRDGQSALFAEAPDTITGELVRVEVTMAVVR